MPWLNLQKLGWVRKAGDREFNVAGYENSMHKCNCWVSTASRKGAVYPWGMGGHITAFLKIKTFLRAGKGKQAFMVIEFYPFRASRWVIKPHCKRGGQERPFQSWGTRSWEGEGQAGGGMSSEPSLGAPALIPIEHPEVADLWAGCPQIGGFGACCP